MARVETGIFKPGYSTAYSCAPALTELLYPLHRSMTGTLSLQTQIRDLSIALSDRENKLASLNGAVSAKAVKGEVMQQALSQSLSGAISLHNQVLPRLVVTTLNIAAARYDDRLFGHQNALSQACSLS